jgi:nicotinamide riboside kinase
MINGKKMIALTGVESTGKTTLTTVLTGRLRTRGILAESVGEAGAASPFPGAFLDSGYAGWMYLIGNKMALEVTKATRANVNVVVCDRTLMDYGLYFKTRFPGQPMAEEIFALAQEWIRQYDMIFYLPRAGSTYRQDGYRASPAENYWHAKADAAYLEFWSANPRATCVPQGFDYRERGEFVYHKVIENLLGETKASRAYEYLREWLNANGVRVLAVHPRGSQSITETKTPRPDSDADAVIIVDGDADYAQSAATMFAQHRANVEKVLQHDLDLCFSPRHLAAHEL